MWKNTEEYRTKKIQVQLTKQMYEEFKHLSKLFVRCNMLIVIMTVRIVVEVEKIWTISINSIFIKWNWNSTQMLSVLLSAIVNPEAGVKTDTKGLLSALQKLYELKSRAHTCNLTPRNTWCVCYAEPEVQ